MKKITFFGFLMIFSLMNAQTPEGTWKITAAAGAIGVGPGQGDISWWSNSAGDVTTRACYFDDEYVFNANGTFSNVQGTQTWLETWQGVSADGCGTPVSPHNGSNAATWSYVGNTITLTGVGAYLGLSKPYNGGELTTPSAAPASITYTVTSLTSALMTLDIAVNGVGWWRYNFTKQGVAATCNDLIQNGDETGVDCGGTSCPACLAQINLPVTFEGSTVNHTVTDFGGNVSTRVVDPTNANNMVMQVDKTSGAALWAGTTIGTPSGFSAAIPFTSTNRKMYVRVWSPDSGIPIRLKVEDSTDPTRSCETQANITVANAWETIEFDFDNHVSDTAPFNAAYTFNMASIFFNFGTDGATAGAKTYYFDDVSYGAVLSVSNFELAAGVTMSPNPSSNFLNFTSIEKIDSISVTNLLGQTLFSKTIQNDTFSVDVSELAKGQYFINLTSREAKITKAFIKN